MTEQLAFCPHCGAKRLSQARFCGKCGAEFPAAPPGPTFGDRDATAPSPRGRPGPPIAANRPTAPRGPSETRRRAPVVAASVGVVVIVAVVVAVVAFVNGRPGVSHQPIPSIDLGLPAPSLGPDAPAFPVPPGATLVNAQVIGGQGPGAARIAAWTSALGYDATVAFYTAMSDSRWNRSGQPQTTLSSTRLSFSDTTGVLAAADVTVSRMDPVRIGLVFRSMAAPAPSTGTAPGPTVVFSSLPPATALPDGFPAALVPTGGTLVDAASIAGTFDAIFTAAADPATLAAAYQSALSGWATGVSAHADGTATIIDFSTPGGPGGIVLVSENGQTTVSIEVRP